MKAGIALFFAGLIAATAYWQFFYPPNAMKRETAQALQQFSDAVATKDRTRIGDSLKAFLSDDAAIKLSVGFFSIANQKPAMVQDFDKTTFVTFIDNVLYPLTDYAYEPLLETFVLAEDKKTAAVTFSSKEWADGSSYYGGTSVGMRFSSVDTMCKGEVAFFGAQVKLTKADCTLTLMTVPKPGEAARMQGDVLKEYLTK